MNFSVVMLYDFADRSVCVFSKWRISLYADIGTFISAIFAFTVWMRFMSFPLIVSEFPDTVSVS